MKALGTLSVFQVWKTTILIAVKINISLPDNIMFFSNLSSEQDILEFPSNGIEAL